MMISKILILQIHRTIRGSQINRVTQASLVSFIVFVGIFCFSGVSRAQTNPGNQANTPGTGLDNWLGANVEDMGGRAILQICKGGRPVYCKSLNQMSGRQKRVDKFIAKRMGREENMEDSRVN